MARDDSSSDDASTDTREQGVEFGRLWTELEDHDYPTTREELIEQYGEYELELDAGTETLEAVLGRQEGEQDERQYESADAVRQAIVGMVGSEAVGRENYTDRGGSLPDESTDGDAEEDESL